MSSTGLNPLLVILVIFLVLMLAISLIAINRAPASDARGPTARVAVVADAFKNTGTGEWIIYAVLLALGIVLIVIGLNADARDWTADNTYATGVLDGATGFCFGVPIAGVAIRELTRRSAEAARERQVVADFAAQLQDFEQHIGHLVPDPNEPAHPQLRELAELARTAQLGADIEVDTPVAKVWIISIGAVKVTVRLGNKEVAARLGAVIRDDRRWALIGFACSSLASAAPQFRAVLYERPAPQRDAFDHLLSSLQGVAVQRIPATWRWLGRAVSDNPEPEIVSFWNQTSPIGALPVILPFMGAPDPTQTADLAAEQTRLKGEWRDRVLGELRAEMSNLAAQLNALADLEGTYAESRGELERLIRR